MSLKIFNFIKSEKIATVCYLDSTGNPNCFTCVYSFDFKGSYLIYKSSNDSFHAQQMMEGAKVAGTILSRDGDFDSHTGIQFTGQIGKVSQSQQKELSKIYYHKYPLALAISGQIWVIQMDFIKLSGKLKTFGVKLTWNR